VQSHTAKQQAIEAIEQLPDNVALDEIVYRLYVLNKVRQGLEDVDAGRVVSSEALAAEIEQW
jgi:predicted transcriptional regulator